MGEMNMRFLQMDIGNYRVWDKESAYNNIETLQESVFFAYRVTVIMSYKYDDDIYIDIDNLLCFTFVLLLSLFVFIIAHHGFTHTFVKIIPWLTRITKPSLTDS